MHFSGVSIVDSEQVNAGWELNAPTLSDSTILIAHCFQNCKFNSSYWNGKVVNLSGY